MVHKENTRAPANVQRFSGPQNFWMTVGATTPYNPPMDGRPLRWFAVLLAASFFVGIPAIDAPYFSDDFQFVFESPVLNPVHYLTWENPHNGFYRPIQSAFLAAVQTGWGLDTGPIHAVQIALHGALAMLLFNVLLGLGFGRREAALGSLLLAVSQAAVMAVSSNDTFSQVLGVLTGYLAVWAFFRSARENPGRALLGDRRYLAGLAWLAVSLFSKETSTAFVLLGAFALLAGTRGVGGARHLGVLAARLAPVVVLVAAYAAARSAVSTVAPEVGSGAYQLNLGPNMVKNVVMLWVAATLPFSSVDMFTALAAGHRTALAGLGAVYAVFVALVAAGLWPRRRDVRLWWLVAAAFGSVTAIVPVNHVSELYTYQLLPLACAIVAIGLGALGEAAGRRRAWRATWGVAVAALVASQAMSAHSKAQMLDDNGRRSDELLDAIVPEVRGLPDGGELVLVNPAAPGPEYSMFRMYGFSPLRHADSYLARRAGREDITVRIVRADEPAAQPRPGRTVLVLDDRGNVERLPSSGNNAP